MKEFGTFSGTSRRGSALSRSKVKRAGKKNSTISKGHTCSNLLEKRTALTDKIATKAIKMSQSNQYEGLRYLQKKVPSYSLSSIKR